MTHVEAFSSWEDLQAKMEADQKAADARIPQGAENLKPGDVFLGHNGECLFYAEVLDPIEEDIKAGADAQEVAYARQTWSQPHMANYRFCRVHSVFVPEGELTDVHLSEAQYAFPRKAFDALKRAETWPQETASLDAFLDTLS